MRTRTALAAAVVVLAMAGCGGDDSGGASGASYCERATAAEDANDLANTVDQNDPAAVEAAVTEAVEAIRDAAEAAPEEIKADVELTLEGFEKLIALFDEAGWDIETATSDPRFAEVATDPTYQEASERVEAYNDQECGIPADPD
jgi:hypothetical protein